MAIGGLFYGEDRAGVLGQFQRNEYSRYSRDIRRRRGRVFVLTGTASVFRPAALRTVAQSRGSSIPGARGDVYDTAALTEDNELTIALKSLGALMISPSQCTVVTEVMPSWRALWNQRLRWQRGALENLGAYGLRPKTFRYWAQQLGIGYGVIALAGYVTLIVLTVLSVSSWVWFPFWMVLGLLFAIERVVTVWAGGWRARLLAVALIPELVFASFLNVGYLKGVMDILFGGGVSEISMTAKVLIIVGIVLGVLALKVRDLILDLFERRVHLLDLAARRTSNLGAKLTEDLLEVSSGKLQGFET